MIVAPAPKIVAATLLAAFLTMPALPVLAAGSGGSDSSTNTAQPSYQDAKAAVDAGQYRNAIRTLKKLVKTDPNNADAWNLLGYSNRKLKKYPDAAAYYRTALKIDPKHLGALEYQGELFVETGEFDQAKANLGRLKKLCGTCEEYSDLQKVLAAAGQS
ncbi:MAG: tetratricopeptide repeat protein [Paracoccaceae bacterium]|nr:tetratricopeptide repeat protein [Paracoccaceae bacterium]MDH5529917.1 tetratricopeptide repeat protein [Paracoccaceae bacterium]